MNPISLEYSILFLQRATSYDGGDEGGSSIFDIFRFFESLGENSWWIFVGIVLLILMVKSILKGIFIDNPREREYHRKFNSDHPTIVDKQNHYDDLFLKKKLEIEEEWNDQSERYLVREGVYKSLSFDMTNKAHYSKKISRNVVKPDYTSDRGYKILTEYWTYDGEWRQGYWDGKFDYSDKNWDKNTLCDILNIKMGDIQPKISTTISSSPSNQNNPLIKEKTELNQNIFLNETTNQDDGDDLPF